MLPAGSPPPSTEVRSSNAGRPEAEDTAPMEAGVPASIAPFSLQEQGAGAPEDFSALAPALSEALAGQLDQSPGRLLLFSTIPEELEDRDWQGDGRLSLDRPGGGGGPLPAGRPDRPGRRPVGERGGGPAVALVYP